MQVGTVFSDGLFGASPLTPRDSLQNTRRVVSYVVETIHVHVPGTYPKHVTNKPVVKKLSQIKELRFYWQSTVLDSLRGRGAEQAILMV